MTGFVCVHIGAGHHSEKYKSQYTQLCRDACVQAVNVLKSDGNAIDAVTVATAVLEDSSFTNAGVGSNLTLSGTVECDATIMDGTNSSFGSVGAVSGVKNPIKLASALLRNQHIPLSLARTPPCFLVGNGARNWGEEKGIETVNPDELITERARKQHLKYKTRMSNSDSTTEEVRLDTVGAICVDNDGRIAASASSGGILLKYPGRVGQAGVYGCGCWAEKNIGISVSGSGEDLIKTGLAQKCASALSSAESLHTSLFETITTSFLKNPCLDVESRRLCGVLGVRVDECGGEMLFGHTTLSMGIGYMAVNQKKPKCIISRMSSNSGVGKSLVIEGIRW